MSDWERPTPLECYAEATATIAHHRQTYQDQRYIEHPRRVVENLRKLGITDPRILSIGWLHDVVEDTNTSLESIRRNFGDRIADGVDAITRRVERDEDGVMVKEYEEAYLERCAANPDASIVKHCDMIDNLLMARSPHCPPEKQDKWQKYLNALETLFIFPPSLPEE